MSKEADFTPRPSEEASGAGTALLGSYRADEPAQPKAKASDDSDSDELDHSDIEVYPPTYPGYEAPSGAHGRAPPAHPHGTEVHWATMAQKRALWWRNAVLTGMFILSW